MRLPISAEKPGTAFVRYAMALAATKTARGAAEYARRQSSWKTTPGTLLALDAAVTAQDTDDVISQYGIAAEFYMLFQQASLIGRLAAQMRPAPFRVKVPAEDSSGTNCAWIAESGLKPIITLSMQSLALEEYKMALIVAISQELARMSKPSAETAIRQILVANVSRFVDAQFLSSNIGIIGERPAGIGYGQQTQASSGATAQNIATDVSSMGSKLGSWGRPTWLTRPRTFQYLAALDLISYAGTQAMFSGFPIYWSEGSPAQIMLLDLNAVLLADDGRSAIDIATHATITLDNGASPASAATVSLFQNNLVALRVERYISWLAGHNAAAVVMPVSY